MSQHTTRIVANAKFYKLNLFHIEIIHTHIDISFQGFTFTYYANSKYFCVCSHDNDAAAGVRLVDLTGIGA